MSFTFFKKFLFVFIFECVDVLCNLCWSTKQFPGCSELVSGLLSPGACQGYYLFSPCWQEVSLVIALGLISFFTERPCGLLPTGPGQATVCNLNEKKMGHLPVLLPPSLCSISHCVPSMTSSPTQCCWPLSRGPMFHSSQRINHCSFRIVESSHLC